MNDFYYKEEPNYTVVGGETVVVLGTFSFTPQKATKFVIMAMADTVLSSPDLIQFDAPYPSLSVANLIVDGITVTDPGGSTYHNTSMVCFKGAPVGVPVNVSLEVRLDRATTIENIRFAAIGVDDWTLIEQQTPDSTEIQVTSSVNDPVIETSIYPNCGDCLIFAYGEFGIRAAVPGVPSGDSFAQMQLDIESDNSSGIRILDSAIVGNKNILGHWNDTDVVYTSISSINRLPLDKYKTSIKWRLFRPFGSDIAVCRRLRMAIVPITKSIFSKVASFPINKIEQNTMGIEEPIKTIDASIPYSLPIGIDSLLVTGYAIDNLSSFGAVQLDTSYVSIDGITNIIGKEMVGNVSSAFINQIYKLGQQGFNFKKVNPTTVEDPKQFIANVSNVFDPSVTIGETIRRSKLEFNIMSFVSQDTSQLTVDTTSKIRKSYKPLTLVEIKTEYDIKRYCLETDTYLFDNITLQNLLDYYNNGNFDNDSILGLVEDGEFLLDALGRANLIDIQLALDNGKNPLIGQQPEIPSSHVDFSNIGKLYKKGIVSEISVNNVGLNPSIINTFSNKSSASIIFTNKNNEFINDFPDLSKLNNCDISIKIYDEINNELHTSFLGKISNVAADPSTIKISASTQDISQLADLYPKLRLKDVTPSSTIQTTLNADDANSLVPIFFGRAPSLKLPSIDIFFGDTTTNPHFLNAYNDYLIGGPGYDSEFPYIKTVIDISPTGIYRNGSPIIDINEFDNNNKSAKETLLTSIADSVELSDPVLAADLRAVAIGLDPITNSLVTMASLLIGLGFPTTAEKLIQLSVGVPFPFGEPTNLTSNIILNKRYSVFGKNLLNLRFESSLLKTPTRTGALGIPHLNGINDDYTQFYPQFTPITQINNIETYIRGTDYIEEPALMPTGIKWLIDAASRPTIALTTAPTITITRTIGQDYLLSDPINSAAAQIYSITSVTISNKTYIENTNFIARSNDPNRQFKDIIDWSQLTAGGIVSWNIGIDGITDSIKTIPFETSTTDGQPFITCNGTCLEFSTTSSSTGRLFTTDAPTNAALNFGISAGFTSIRMVIDVATNAESQLSGFVAGRTSIYPAAEKGYFLQIMDEVAAGVVGGDPTKNVVVATIANGTITHTLAGTTKVNDGTIHRIELRYDSTNANSINNFQLVVDDILDNSLTVAGTFDLDATTDFSIGDQPTTNPAYNNFLGRIYNIFVANDKVAVPTIGEQYFCTVGSLPDTYNVDYTYNLETASNPIQRNSNSIFLISGDFEVAGSTITPDGVTGNMPVISNNAVVWAKGPGSSGYALRLNATGTFISPWSLGTSQLGVDTTLGGAIPGSVDGRVEFLDKSKYKLTGDMGIYGYAAWKGLQLTPSSVLLAKELATPVINSGTGVIDYISYGIGIVNGKGWGRIYAKGIGVEIVGTSTITDGAFHLIHIQREGLNINLYVDGNLEGTKSIKQSVSTDYDTGLLMLGSDKIYNSRWQGDVSFFGITGFAGGQDFSKLLFDQAKRGIKGSWATDLDGNSTILHVPLIEGPTNTVVKERNIQRNPIFAIKQILSDQVIGLNKHVDGRAFDDAITTLDNIGLNVDYSSKNQGTIGDIIDKLSYIRGIQLKKNAIGAWTVAVDTKPTTVKRSFGYNDGFFNNISKVIQLSYLSSDIATKSIILNYNKQLDTTGSDELKSFTTRSVLSYGKTSQTLNNDYIIDDSTADQIINYLSKRIAGSTESIQFSTGQEARDLVPNDVIRISIPGLGIIDRDYKIKSINSSATKYTIVANTFNLNTYTYDKNSSDLSTDTVTNIGINNAQTWGT